MALKSWIRVKPLEDGTVENFEKQHSIMLSNELKECIKEFNSGRPEPNVVKLQNGIECEVKMLLSYSKGDTENIFKVIDYFINQYNGNIIPFASDSAGNYFCEQKDGKVVYWTQENEIFPVCDNFKTFLESLYDID